MLGASLPPAVIQAGRVVPLPRPLPAAMGATGSAAAFAGALEGSALGAPDPGAVAAVSAAPMGQSLRLEVKRHGTLHVKARLHARMVQHILHS